MAGPSDDKKRPTAAPGADSGEPKAGPSLHSEVAMVSVEEATRRHFERQRLAKERDDALGWPDPPTRRGTRRRQIQIKSA